MLYTVCTAYEKWLSLYTLCPVPMFSVFLLCCVVRLSLTDVHCLNHDPSIDEDSGSEQGDASSSLSDVHGEIRRRDCPDRPGDPRGPPEGHHRSLDCRGTSCAAAQEHRKMHLTHAGTSLYLTLPQESFFALSVYRRSTRTGKSSLSRSSKWLLLIWSTWASAWSATP